MMRNEEDVVALSVRHHLRIGCERILVVDNGSNDATGRALDRLARRDPRVKVSHDPGPFRQSDVISALVHEAAALGARWVLPFDADEFWWVAGTGLREMLRQEGDAGAIEARVVNFVQRRHQKRRGARALLAMTARTAPVGTVAAGKELVTSKQISFVEIRYPPKVLVRAAPDVVVTDGNHGVIGAPGPVVERPDLAVLHAPLRTREVLAARADFGRRVAAVSEDLERSWHARRWLALFEEHGPEALDDEWAANSQLRGYLDVHGVRHRVVRDTRLRTAVRAAASERWRARRARRQTSTRVRGLTHEARGPSSSSTS